MSLKPRGKKRKLSRAQRTEGTHEEVLLADVRELLGRLNLAEDEKASPLPDRFAEVEVTIQHLSSTGDGLGHVAGSNYIISVPFTAPGDVVKARFVRYDEQVKCAIADLVKVERPASERQDSLIRCPYFAECSGCQFQMLPYANQLAHKQRVVERAYRNFSGLPAKLVPEVGETIGSPLQYGYRTKLTPHFDGPPGGRRAGRKGEKAHFPEVPPIGFMKKGVRKIIDIEECPIGTDAVQMGLKREKKRVANELENYSRGATILLRESTDRVPRDEISTNIGIDEDAQTVAEACGPYVHVKRCITDNKATTTEYVDDFVFKNLANSFFQNNNSILPIFTSYIRKHVKPAMNPASYVQGTLDQGAPEITNFIDAYCGSGLFTVTLSSLFKRSVGIDIDEGSIKFARLNASLNASKPQRLLDEVPVESPSCTEPPIFLSANANTLFRSVPNSFDPSKTVVIIDPPRKGCDEDFLRQLLDFDPTRIIYVSCNVHTQARDVGWLLRGGKNKEEGVGTENLRYEIESLRGFDFFPQTGHVESVAVLRKSGSGLSTINCSGNEGFD